MRPFACAIDLRHACPNTHRPPKPSGARAHALRSHAQTRGCAPSSRDRCPRRPSPSQTWPARLRGQQPSSKPCPQRAPHRRLAPRPRAVFTLVPRSPRALAATAPNIRSTAFSPQILPSSRLSDAAALSSSSIAPVPHCLARQPTPPRRTSPLCAARSSPRAALAELARRRALSLSSLALTLVAALPHPQRRGRAAPSPAARPRLQLKSLRLYECRSCTPPSPWAAGVRSSKRRLPS